MAIGQARFLGTAHADPACPPTHRRTATGFYYHRGRNNTDAAGVPSKRLDAWAVPDPSDGVDAPWLLGVVVQAGPQRLPLGAWLAGRAVAQCLRNWSILKTSFLWSMW